MSVLLESRALRHVYPGGHPGLQDCSLVVRAGSRNALLGGNGSGKTTWLMHCNGLLQPSAGSVHFAGAPLAYGRAELHALRRRVGLVFQNPEQQLFSANVAEDVSFGPLNLGLPEAEVRQRVADALAAVGMQEAAQTPIHRLSFGQKKRVCLAGVLAMQPELLLLDEPMAGLDAAMQDDLLALLENLTACGITIILSTHDIDFAYRWADAIHLLAAGRCVASFASADLAQHAEALHAAGQRLPAVLAVQEALAQQGLSFSRPARSLPDLLSGLAALPSSSEKS